MSEQSQSPRSGQPATPDPAMVALGRALERTNRRFAELSQDVTELAEMVRELANTVAGCSHGEPGDDPDKPPVAPVPPLRSWLLADDPQLAEADLGELIVWLDRVYLRFHDAALSSCWMWHPPVVEELWWLRCAHVEAYHPKKGSWMKAGDWHDRQRPGVVRRVKEAIGSCELALHVAGQRHGQDPAVAPLSGYTALVAQAWATPDGPRMPAPTQAQLDEADWLARSATGITDEPGVWCARLRAGTPGPGVLQHALRAVAAPRRSPCRAAGRK